MAGRHAGAAITRYPGLQVQTSSLGLPIPVGWGTFRCKTNLVWYGGFHSVAQQAAATGKGGGSTTTGYTYFADLILALCEGVIDSVTKAYINGKELTNGSTTALAQANLNLATGAIGQAVWSYLSTTYPSEALGYSGLAYVYQTNYDLGGTASTPNHSFEVVRTTGYGVSGTPDADPSLVISDLLTNARYGIPGWISGLIDTVSLTTAANSYQKYCLAAGLLVSPILDTQRSAKDFLTELFRATNSTCVWSEGLLKFIPYGDRTLTANGVTYTPNITPVYSLTDDQFVTEESGSGKGNPPVAVDIVDQSDAYNLVQLEYLDRTSQYNMAIALASDAANVAQYGQRRKDPDTVHVICTPEVAAVSAHLFLQRQLYIRAQYKFKLGWMFGLLEPGDLLELTDAGLGLSTYTVRIIQIDEAGSDQKGAPIYDLICEDYPLGVHHAPLYSLQGGLGKTLNRGVDPGGVESNLLLQSETWTSASWTKSDLTITAAATTNPIYGATDATKMTPDTSNLAHYTFQGFAAFAGANYTFTAYFKNAGYNFVRLLLDDNAGVDQVSVVVDLTTGAATKSTTGAGVLVSASATAVGSGWYRVAVTGQLPSAVGPAAQIEVFNNSAQRVFAGDGTSGIYAYAAQLTQGVDVRPYAATTTAISGPIMFNPPIAMTPKGTTLWAAVSGGAHWGGANIWVSMDGGSNYDRAGHTNAGDARYGVLTAAYAVTSDPDTTHTISIDLGASAGVFNSAADSVADKAGTACLIDNEVVSYSTATLTSPYRYNLTSYIRRAQYNTAEVSHAIGAPIVRLDGTIFDFPYLKLQEGQSIMVKFQSFNHFGDTPIPLSNCRAYTVVPFPTTSRIPRAASWTATAIELANAGQSVPAIQITGASDNPSATAIEFVYRIHGTSTWISAGLSPPATTLKIITSVIMGDDYDVGVAYMVNGSLTAVQTIATGLIMGTITTSAGPGSTLLADSTAVTGGTFTCPAGSYAHVDIVITGLAGDGSGTISAGGKGSTYTDYGGGGGGAVVVKGFPVTAGSTTFTFTLPSTIGNNATITATGLSLTAHSGVSATSSGAGAGAAASTGNTATGATSLTSYAGHNGGLTDTWDGGGAADINGTITDNINDGTPGVLPGQGGAGTWAGAQLGAGCKLLIIARA